MEDTTFIENLTQRKIPTVITYLVFFALFCMLTLLYHITLYIFDWTVLVAFRIPMPVEEETEKGISLLTVILCIEFFGVLLNFYCTQYITKGILNKWYNKIPIFQEKKLFVPTSILFMTLLPIISILWIIAYMKNSTLDLFFRSINGYVILLFLVGLSFYLSYKIIKKLQH